MSSSIAMPKRMSGTMTLLIACFLGVGMGLFGLNYYYASKCTPNHSPSEMEEYVDALNRRLLEAESLTIRNGVMMEKVIHLLQSRLVSLETSEFEKVSKTSEDEAVRLALLLASQPAPPMPEFAMDPKYNDLEKIADLVDDVFVSVGEESLYSLESYNDPVGESETDTEFAPITDAEASTLCTEWKRNYNVVTGVSWGDLPYELQQKWLHYSCDYHLADDNLVQAAPGDVFQSS
jgi:hypothetical protein